MRWTANAAHATGAAFINLNEIVALEFEKLRAENVEALFADRRTHSTPAGALLNAEMVIAGMRALKFPNFTRYYSDKGKTIKPKSKFVVSRAGKN